MTIASMSWTGHQNNRYHFWEEWQQVPGNVKVNNMNIYILYIRYTSRTVGSRIKEHVRMEKQTIYHHLVKHTNTPILMLKDISWDILHNNIPQHQTRKIIEALN